jgi:hypothetical protein
VAAASSGVRARGFTALATSWLSLIAGATAFGLYARTAAHTITWEHRGPDAAELSAAAYVLGIPHPPGFPLYMLLGHVFIRLIPFGEVAFRMALLSAVAAAVAVALAARLGSRLTEAAGGDALVGGAAAAVALATAPLFWSQATIPESYTLHLAIVLGALNLLADWSPGQDHRLVPLALLLGLGLGNHLTLLFAIGCVGLYVLLEDPSILRRRAVLAVGAAFAAGLLVYLYVPIRAAVAPPLNWSQPDTLERFIEHITGRVYQGYIRWEGLGETLSKAPPIARLLGEQVTWPGLAVAFLGIGILLQRRPAFARLLVGYALITMTFTALYHTRDQWVYFLPVAPLEALALGVGAGHLAQTLADRRLVAGVLGLVFGLQVVVNWAGMDISGDVEAATYARETLTAAPRDGILFTDEDHTTFALWYVQIVERVRPDVTVVDRRMIGAPWYRTQLERQHPGVLLRGGL